MTAADAAKAVLLQQHGNVPAEATAVGITQEMDYLLINGMTPTAEREENIKLGGMGEEALTLLRKPMFSLQIETEATSVTGTWFNRHPGEVLTYNSVAAYTSDPTLRHKFPATATGTSWSVRTPQVRRPGDLATNQITLKLLWKPTLAAAVLSAEAA